MCYCGLGEHLVLRPEDVLPPFHRNWASKPWGSRADASNLGRHQLHSLTVALQQWSVLRVSRSDTQASDNPGHRVLRFWGEMALQMAHMHE